MLLLAACDEQAPADYDGEPLLSMHGRVELALEPDNEAALIPALAFQNYEQGELRIVDVEASGEFPAEFSLDVYLPPPEEAFVAIAEHIDEPKVAIGYITAVTEEHPEAIPYASFSSESFPEPVEGGGTVQVSTWCANDESECYMETTTCPSLDSPPEDCDVTNSGDPTLKQDPWEHFAGLSQNYAVVYLPEAVSAGSITAWSFGAEDGLSAGYHLLKLEPHPDADQPSMCRSDALQLAIELYNEQHDTAFGVEAVSGGGCHADDCPTREELGPLLFRATVELRCPSETLVTPIEDPENEAISVLIGDNLSPFGG